MLCLYLTILGIWKGISYARKRKRSREELVQGKSEEINIENGDSCDVKPEKKKKCPNKNLILGLIQFILVSGTMAFVIYMINGKTEKDCGNLEIPEKWKCQFNHFFNTNYGEDQGNQHFHCPAVTNKTFHENLAVVHGYARNITDDILKVLNINILRQSPLLDVFENVTTTPVSQNSTTMTVLTKTQYPEKNVLPKIIQHEIQTFLYIIHKITKPLHNKIQQKDSRDIFDLSTAPAIVTAMSDSNINEGKLFIKNVVRKIYPLQDVQKLIIYDFGLSDKHITILKKRCSFCEFRKFPFEIFANLTIHFALKPLMIELAMNEFGTVIWADPYIRFNPVYLRDIVKASQQYGIQVAKNNEKVRITNQEVRHKINKYLNEEKCMDSFDEIQSKFLVFSQETSAYDVVLPWIRASIGYGNMVKENGDKLFKQKVKSIYNPVEETILGIIVNRLYNKHMSKVMVDMNEYAYIDVHLPSRHAFH
jgi:hypothetical protein